MSLTKYRTFLKVAATGSFSAAAEQMHCTQSAASRMIHDLEDLWGIQLFSRFKTGAVLTPEGEALLPLIQRTVLADEDIKAAVTACTNLLSGTVRIASFASVATHWLPQVIKAFKSRYPQIHYEILMGDFGEIEHWVKTGRVDFGFTDPEISDGLDSLLVAKDELLLAVNSAHPFANLSKVPAKLLNEEPFFLLEKGKKSSVTAYLQKQNIHPAIELTTFEDYAIMNMVKTGVGVGILPNLVLQYPVEGVQIKHLDPRGFREIRLVIRSGGKLSLATQKFLDTFAQELAGVIDPGFKKCLDIWLFVHSCG